MKDFNLLENAICRLIAKVRARNIYPKGKINHELYGMVDILRSMGFEVIFEWDIDTDYIIKVKLLFEGESIERIA